MAWGCGLILAEAGFYSLILQPTLDGLVLGSAYALIALGYTMVYGVLKLINFAHSEVFMLGAMFSVAAVTLLGLHVVPSPFGLVIAVLIAMVVCCIAGVLIERVAYRPLRSSSRLTALITAIGLSLFIQSTAQINFGEVHAGEHRVRIGGSDARAVPRFLSHTDGSGEFKPLILLGAAEADRLVLSPTDAIILPTTLAVLAVLWWFTQKTRAGRSIRAVSWNKDHAALMGVNVDRAIALTFLVGSAMAGIAAVLLAYRQASVEPLMGSMYGLKSFVAAVLGGIGSLPGAALGAVLLGVSESYVANFIDGGSRYRDTLVFGILILVLLIRPAGLLGRAGREKV